MKYVETWKAVIFNPSNFFQKMPIEENYSNPVRFVVINALTMSLLAVIVGPLWDPRMAVLWEFGIFSATFFALLLPVLVVPGIFLFSTVLHISFMSFGGKGSYEGTFRVLAYSSSVGVFELIPVLHLLNGFYGVYLQILGGKYVHNLSTVRSAMAVLLPVAVVGIWLFLNIWDKIY